MDIYERAVQLSYWGPIVLFSIGVPGAIFNVIIFLGMKTFRKSPAAYYVIGQSFFDVIALLIVLLQILPTISISASSISCKLMVFVAQLTVSCAMSFLCLAAFDRWACTSQSAKIRQLNSNHTARRLFFLPVLLYSLIYTPYLVYCDLIPPFYTCGFTSDLFAQIGFYFISPIIGVVLPLLILITFGMLTYRNIRLVTHIRQQPIRNRLSMWEQQMTRMMLAQTLISISCTLPRTILVIYTIATVGGRATRSFDQVVIEFLIDQVTLFIITLNFASSFYIFLLSSARLRETLKMHLKRLFNLRHNQVGHMSNSLTAQPLTMRHIAHDSVNMNITTIHI